MDDAVAYWLLFVDLVIGVAVIWLAIWLVQWAIRRFVRRGHSLGPQQQPNAVKRRCDDCGSSWWTAPGRNLSLIGLRVRRSIRRSRRHKKRSALPWAAKQGWNRCPSCMSRRVRDSSGQAVGLTRAERREQRLLEESQR